MARMLNRAGEYLLIKGSRSQAWLMIAVMMFCFAQEAHAGQTAGPKTTDQTVGTGDGRIHVIPALSAPSVKNGGTLTIQAVVKAAAGVAKVEAEIEGVETIQLKPAPKTTGGVATSKTKVGVYQADWKAHGLKEKVYSVSIRATDLNGQTYTDRTAEFSDPVAGNTAVGTTIYPADEMRRLGTLSFTTGDDYAQYGVIDQANGYGYFATGTYPARIVKVALGQDNSLPTDIGSTAFNPGESQLMCAAIDTVRGYAYFGNYGKPPTIFKVALGNGNELPRKVNKMSLYSWEDTLCCALIDETNGYGYFATRNNAPAVIVKVALGDGDSTPTRVGDVVLGSGENYVTCGVIDPANGYAYFGTNSNPGRIVKVALGSGSNPPTRVGAVTLASGEQFLNCGVIDAANGYAYFCMGTPPGKIVKIKLGSGAAAPTRLGTLTLNSGEDYLYCGAIDKVNGCAYWGGYYYRAYKTTLGTTDTLPARVGTVPFVYGEALLSSANLDQPNGYVYFAGGNGSPSLLTKAAVSYRNQVQASRMQMIETGSVNDVRFYSHRAAGNLRLAIYDSNVPQNLLWESNATTNTTAGGWITIPIASGAPSSLLLPNGNYWLAWQTDTAVDVASYTAGSSGSGYCADHAFGSFPATIDNGSIRTTANLWSEYVTYDVSITAPDNPSADAITSNSIHWTWRDNSPDENGFKVWADQGSGPPTTLRTTTTANATSLTMPALSFNTQYSFQTAATKAIGDSARTANLAVFTLIEPVAGLTFSSVGTNLISVAASNTPSKLAAGFAGMYFANTTASTNSGWQHNNTAWASTGLMPNTLYSFSGKSRNGDTIETTAVTANKYTLAATPVTPVLSGAQLNSITVTIGSGDGNPAATEYAIYCDTASKWVQADGALGSSAAWATPATWGMKTVTGLNSATVYAFRSRARNAENIETGNGASASLGTLCSVGYSAGANGSITGNTSQTVNYGGSCTQVTAVSASYYHFVQWSDGVMTATRTDTNVTTNKNVTATFAINTYTISYSSGAHGSISGSTPQTISWGTTSTQVTAIPATGYHFVQWNDGLLTAARRDLVTTNVTKTASFAINQYTLTYYGTAHGPLFGTTPQTVNYCGSGSSVQIVPDYGYHFTNWSDGRTDNSRFDSPVTGNITVTGYVAVNMYTLSYTAGAGGSISGVTPQSVPYEGSGSSVTAVPNMGYHFLRWSDGRIYNSRCESYVRSNVYVTAIFAINTYTLNYTAGANGSIQGTASQTVNYNTNGTTVTAVAASGYYFCNWSDGSTVNPRTDINVSANVAVTAAFAANATRIWVKFDYLGTEDGTQANPFNTVGEGVDAVSGGGAVRIYAGSTATGIRIVKPLRLEAWGGTVRIGRSTGLGASLTGLSLNSFGIADGTKNISTRDWVNYR